MRRDVLREVLEEFVAAQGLAQSQYRFDYGDLPARVGRPFRGRAPKKDRRADLKAWWEANKARLNASKRGAHDSVKERTRKQRRYYADVKTSRRKGRVAAKRRYERVKHDPEFIRKNRERASAHYWARKKAA